jgi:hypothetical protein
MRTPSLLVSLLSLAFAPACQSSEDEGQGEGETEGERTVEEWIELCESQQSRNACEAVSPGMRGSETWSCDDLMIVQTSETSGIDCYANVVDSRCFAVSDDPSSGSGYILAEPSSMQTWLIEPSPNTTVHGSAVEACVLADDGVTWTPDPMCACSGMVSDETGA